MMWCYRSRGRPSPQQIGYDADQRRTDTIEERYTLTLAYWSEVHGCEWRDYTPGQLRRFRALEAAGGDDETARGLLYGRLLCKTGRIIAGGRASAEVPV